MNATILSKELQNFLADNNLKLVRIGFEINPGEKYISYKEDKGFVITSHNHAKIRRSSPFIIVTDSFPAEIKLVYAGHMPISNNQYYYLIDGILKRAEDIDDYEIDVDNSSYPAFKIVP